MTPGNPRDPFARELVALRPSLLRQGLALTGNIPDAEDLVQSAITRALERRDTLLAGSNLAAWMAVVMRNLAIDQSRLALRKRMTTVDLSDLPCEEPPVRQRRWREIDDQEIWRALAACSPELRQSFELRHFQGLSTTAIAQRTGVPPRTVGTRIHRARARIRAALGGSGAAAA